MAAALTDNQVADRALFELRHASNHTLRRCQNGGGTNRYTSVDSLAQRCGVSFDRMMRIILNRRTRFVLMTDQQPFRGKVAE